MLAILCAITLVSCSKDTDLLADYVISDDDTLITGSKIVNDTYSIGLNQSIVLDVLSNDNFAAGSTVTIVNVTNPRYGKVVINEDNTLTYTPASGEETAEETSEGESSNDTAEETTENDTSNDSEESQESNEENQESNEDSQESNEETTEDSFDYTTEETNEAGETTTAEGTVTLTTGESKIPTSGSNVYFVTNSGSSNNNGRSEENAWDLNHAIKVVNSGDIVYIKSGRYNNQSFRFTKNGTNENPIRFIGYKDSPGDIDVYKQNMLDNNTQGRRGSSRYANNREFDYTERPSDEEMPYFFKTFVKNDDPAFNISGDYVELYNFIVEGYHTAFNISSSSQGAKIINTITLEQGNMDVEFRNSGHPDRYSGTGYSIYGATEFVIAFNTNLNSEQNAFQISGCTNGQVTDNISYSYNVINGTDYNFLLSGNNGTPTSGMTIEYNSVHRNTGVAHGGHAFVAKNGANNNTIRNFHVKNSSVEVNFTNVYENTFEKGMISGSYITNGDTNGSIFQTNGAHHNTFKDIIVDGSWGGIISHDYDDGASSDANLDAEDGGVNNYFINIIVKNAKYGVIYSETGRNSSGNVRDNEYLNCTFFNVEFGIRAYMPNTNNKFYNCSFNTYNQLITNHEGIVLNPNTLFENCHFNGGSNNTSVTNFNNSNNIQGNPEFLDAESVINGEFNVSGLQLSESSPLRSNGQDVSRFNSESATDFNGNTRTVYNIGAF